MTLRSLLPLLRDEPALLQVLGRSSALLAVPDPARAYAIAGVADTHGRPITPGEPANLTILDPTEPWHVTPAILASKARNTPYVDTQLKGRVTHTILQGTMTVQEGTPTK